MRSKDKKKPLYKNFSEAHQSISFSFIGKLYFLIIIYLIPNLSLVKLGCITHYHFHLLYLVSLKLVI